MTSDSKKGPELSGGGRPRDRRAAHRAAIEIPAVLELGTREVDCAVRDLSVRGVCLSLKEKVAPGMVVRVSFRLPNFHQPVQVSAVLVRSEGGRQEGTVGLQFVQPNADAVRAIEAFVFRNRSDQPFSGGRDGERGGARVKTSESAVIEGLYQQAVDEVAEKGSERRGLLSRWFGRRKS